MTTRSRLLVMASTAVFSAWMVGCSTDTKVSSGDDPTTRALSDPMNYSPKDQDQDIAGGGLTDFHQDAFKKDMDHVLNP